MDGAFVNVGGGYYGGGPGSVDYSGCDNSGGGGSGYIGGVSNGGGSSGVQSGNGWARICLGNNGDCF